jgi:hypothetical protein
MNQDPILVVMVKSISPDVVAPIDDEHLPPQLAGDSLGNHTAGEAGPNNKIIKHRLPPRRCI